MKTNAQIFMARLIRVRTSQRLFLQLLILFMLCSCAVGPDYKRPDMTSLTPSHWRWKLSEPKDEVPKGEWWKVFNDATLNELESSAVSANQNLSAAVARVDAARAVARIERSQFFPELSVAPSIRRERTSGNQPTPVPIRLPSVHLNTYSAPLDLGYEVDLWGRVRRSFEAAKADAEASVSDYQNVLLTLTGDVAVKYFLVRSLDSEIATLLRTIEMRRESLRIMSDRFAAGVISEIDVEQAKTELANDKADLTDTTLRRAETVNALALLCGKPASSFEIAAHELTHSPPAVPAGIPSSLLERRPDIARAERNLAARSARIGVAVAGYFPVLSLTGQAGYLGNKAANFFSDDSRVWSIGTGIRLPLFNGGRTAAEVEQAKASYDEALAEYRHTVLAAFKDVEDALAQIVLRNDQAAAVTEALASAKRVTELSKARYEAGAVSYLEVVDAERNMLLQERRENQLEGQRFASSVLLIKALGGGWQKSDEKADSDKR